MVDMSDRTFSGFDYILDDDDIIVHYGVKYRSGRFPYGSGENPYQHDAGYPFSSSGDFLSRVEELKKQGITSELQLAEMTGCYGKKGTVSTEVYRAAVQYAQACRRSADFARATQLKAEGLTNAEIAEALGYKGESSVRSLLNEDALARKNTAIATADILKEAVDSKGMIAIGAGDELELGCSREKLNTAIMILESQGYEAYNRGLAQVTNPGKQTNILVLCPPGTEYSEAYDNSKIDTLNDYVSHDGGETYQKKFQYPESMDSSRLMIRYAEDGGKEKDGTIEIRRGVDDLDLGGSHYSQVRILVDDTKYLKGMAFYSADDMPDGVDVIFNTNKTKDVAKMDVLKDIKNDSDNPFGSAIKDADLGGQYTYTDKDGNQKLGLINKRADEGDWHEWKDKLPSQFLAKQDVGLIKKQLTKATDEKQSEFDDICSLTNPTVKKKMLETFADECDSAAETLAAAALPGQKYQVILPATTLKSNEVYDTNYANGSTVALVRFPHAGQFEIPICTVNNNNAEAKSILGTDSKDAMCINSKTAQQLSGADFDGDTVLVIPFSKDVQIQSQKAITSLATFDPSTAYPARSGMAVLSKSQQQKEMGVVSNLITDMTIKGAPTEDIVKAVKHSMVVIDAVKHNLDYKRSEVENDIIELKKTYQGHTDLNGDWKETGAATLLSRAKNPTRVTKTQGEGWIDSEGNKVYKEADDAHYVTKSGVAKTKTQETTQMAVVDDAHKLSTGTVVETLYGNYANSMKSLAKKARLEYVATKENQINPSAQKTYESEVKSLEAKLLKAQKNAPRERKAQLLANAEMDAIKKSGTNYSKEDIKKLSNQKLAKARVSVGAQRYTIKFEGREWEAVQAGAISKTKLRSILTYSDDAQVKQLATPRKTTALSSGTQARIKALRASGKSIEQIATALGISTSSVWKYAENDGKSVA